MNNLVTNTVKKDNVWATVASVIVPLVQLVAVIVVDVNDTLNLDELFLDAQVLPLANVLSLVLIAASIGFYWYWKENFNWFNTSRDRGSSSYTFPQKSIKNLLRASTILAVVGIVFLMITITLGRSTSEEFLKYNDLFAIVQIVSYVLFITSIGITAYIGLSEYSLKLKQFKPEQYLGNLRFSMNDYGVVRPNIQIREKRNLTDNQLNVLVKLDVDGEEKYLVTSFDGKEIYQVLTSQEYQNVVSAQQPNQGSAPGSQ